jgi:6,7-dimethyl-8-ribityllumazine synthase
MGIKTITAQSGADLTKQVQIAIVVADYHQIIADKLLAETLARLAERGVADSHIQIIRVPGTVEIPLVLKVLAQQQRAHAMIVLGAVITDGSNNSQAICDQINRGCQDVMMAYEVPVIFGVLLEDANHPQSSHPYSGHTAADSALAMVSILNQVVVDD